MTSGILARILIAAVVATGGAGTASAAASAAIFPFEVFDTSGEARQPDLNERLAMATRVLSEALEIVREHTEGQMMQPLGWALEQHTAFSRMACCVNRHAIAVSQHIETEGGIKGARRFEVRDGERKVIERVNAECTGPAV